MSSKASDWLREAMAAKGDTQPPSPFRTDNLTVFWCQACRAAGRRIVKIMLADCLDRCPGGKDCTMVLACPVCDGP